MWISLSKYNRHEQNANRENRENQILTKEPRFTVFLPAVGGNPSYHASVTSSRSEELQVTMLITRLGNWTRVIVAAGVFPQSFASGDIEKSAYSVRWFTLSYIIRLILWPTSKRRHRILRWCAANHCLLIMFRDNKIKQLFYCLRSD